MEPIPNPINRMMRTSKKFILTIRKMKRRNPLISQKNKKIICHHLKSVTSGYRERKVLLSLSSGKMIESNTLLNMTQIFNPFDTIINYCIGAKPTYSARL